MASIRIIHSAAPTDAPEADLHIWTPLALGRTFTTPVPISDALAEFMGLPSGSEVTRSDITRSVINYAQEHKLLNRQNINADQKLTALLNPEPTTQLCILNLQKYLRKHITSQSRLSFQSWWMEREYPLWVGVNLDPVSTSQYESVYQLFANDAYKYITVVIFANVRRGDGPCGCSGITPCDYHRGGEEAVAVCGCSEEYSIKCAYHAAL